MSRVPTILADESLRFTPQGEATPSAFSSTLGLGELAQGLGQLSAGLASASSDVKRAQAKHQRDIDDRWVGDSLAQELKAWNEWQANPDNNQSEDYAKNFRAFSDGRRDAYTQAAPSQRAAAELKRRLDVAQVSRDAENWGVTMRTRVSNTRDSIVGQVASAMDLYRSSLGIPGRDAIGELTATTEDIKNRIDSFFEGSDPDVARKLRGYVDSEMALAVAPSDPVEAELIAKNSDNISEEHRQILLNKIESITKDRNQVAKDAFTQERQDIVSQWRMGRMTTPPLPMHLYEQAYDHATAVRNYNSDVQQYKVYSRVDQNIKNLGELAAPYQDRELAKMQRSVMNETDEMAYRLTAQRMSAIQELQLKDRVGWLRQYNGEVKMLDAQLQGVTGPQRERLLNARNTAVLKYQGYAPPGDPNPEKYLGLATSDRSLLSQQDALASATFINQGTPGEVIGRIEKVLAEVPDPTQQYIAFNDLVSLTPRTQAIRPEYQLVWQNKDQWWVQSFVQAISAEKATAQLTDEKKSKLEAEIGKDRTWKLFEEVMAVGGREKEAEAFRQGVLAFANHFSVAQGDELKKSVNKSIDLLIGSTLGFTSVHGRALMVLKDRDLDDFLNPQPPRTDEEVKDLGRMLEVSLRDLDPRAIDQSRFVALNGVNPDPKNIDRLQALRDIITQRGFFVTDNDGQSATLFITGDEGIPFQVRDTEGRAFQIYFDDVPKYTHQVRTMLTGGYLTSTEPDKPQGRYPLREGYNPGVSDLDKLLGIAQKKTNWPTGGAYRRKVVR